MLMELGDMNAIRIGGHHAIVAGRNWLVVLAVVAMINTAACTAGLRMGGEGGDAANGGGSGNQGFTTTGGSAGGPVTLDNTPYDICPCTDSSAAAVSVGAGPGFPDTGGSAGSGGSGDSSGLFTSVSMGSSFDTCCGVKSDQTIACWGVFVHPYDTPPAGTFNSVSVGGYFACGVRTDGTMVCWGANPPTPPAGTFTSVSVSNNGQESASAACAVRTDGTIACWAASPSDTLVPPRGTFTYVSMGTEMACGVKTDGSLACWHKAGPVLAPAGKFTSFSVGTRMACGVKSDGTIACYVPEDHGCSNSKVDCVDSTPPEGRFTTVSAGKYTTCGVKADGTLACWGYSPVALAGTFVSVSVGGDGGVCAVRTGGTLVCWVNEYRDSGSPEGGF